MQEELKDRAVDTSCRCSRCNALLTEENAREVSVKWQKEGLSYYCIHCEQTYFLRLEECMGRHMALFICCAAFNVPCQPTVLAETDFDTTTDPWITYIQELAAKEMDKKKGVIYTFFNGVTNIMRIFGREMTEKDFSKYLHFEQEKAMKANGYGTPEQRERWGAEKWMNSNKVYEELDRRYENRVDEFKGQQLTAHQEDTIINVCKWSYIMDSYIAEGKIKTANEILSLIDRTLSAEAMRKKDEKPVESFRFDALIDSMEKKQLIDSNKHFLTYRETVKALRDAHVKSSKYNYSLDAADQILYTLLNAYRRNQDLPMVDRLEDDMLVEDEYGEFLDHETSKEQANREYAQLSVKNVKKRSKKKE